MSLPGYDAWKTTDPADAITCRHCGMEFCDGRPCSDCGHPTCDDSCDCFCCHEPAPENEP